MRVVRLRYKNTTPTTHEVELLEVTDTHFRVRSKIRGTAIDASYSRSKWEIAEERDAPDPVSPEAP